MFSHVMLGANDLDASVKFYNALLGALGAKPGSQDRHRYFWRHAGNTFSVTTPINGEPATAANGFTLGFAAESVEQALQAYEAALATGGTAIEDAPGWRGDERMKLYLAYLRDPSGNKVCVMHRPPKTA